jgi:hypothetical protein
MNNAEGRVSDLESAWWFDAQLRRNKPYGGYVLKNIHHGEYTFAKDVRVTRIWLYRKKGAPKSLVLGSPELPADVDEPKRMSKTGGKKEPKLPDYVPLGFYQPVFGVRAVFKTSNVFGEGSGDLEITQEYLFTLYNNTPAHEPTTTLSAARFYPLLHFSYKPGDKKDEHVLTSLRADYRLHITIDQYLDRTRNEPGKPNQAGVFKDTTHPSKTEVALVGLSGIFERLEKPLRYEIVSDGIVFGSTGTYDNIHQWGVQRTEGKNDINYTSKDGKKFILPTTPGAYHCFHMHWRWTEAAPGMVQEKRPSEGGQFGIPPGRPLIDSKIYQQVLTFAITNLSEKTKKELSDPDENASHMDFKSLFTDKQPPDEIDKGGDLVTWLSFTVKRFIHQQMRNDPLEGVLFVHGCYFPHEKDPEGTGAGRLRASDKKIISRTWER